MKKIISLLVVLAMVMALVPAVFADSNVIAPGDGVEIPVTAGTTLTISVSHGDCYINDAPFRVSDDDGDGIISATINDYMNQGFVALVNYGTEPLTWDYADAPGGDSDDSGNSGNQGTADTTLELGDNNVVLAAGDADGETLTFNATESGNLAIEITAFAYDEGFGMGMQEVPPMYIGMAFRNFVFEVNGVQAYEPSATIPVNAGDEVTVVFACPMMRYATEAVFTLSMAEGGDTPSENLNSTLFAGSGTMDDPYIIESVPVDLQFTLDATEMDIYFQYTATEAGTLTFTDPTCTAWFGNTYSGDPYAVNAGDVVIINTFVSMPSEFGSHSVSIAFSAGEGGGNQGGDNTPSENLNSTLFAGSGTYDDPYIIDSIPVDLEFTLDENEMDIYFQCTATEDGFLTFTDPTCTVWFADTWSPDAHAVTAGDVLLINTFVSTPNELGNHSVTIAYGEGGAIGGGETTPVHSGVESVTADQSVEILFTPDADGVLTIDISADPGYRLEVQNAATLDTIGLREESSQPQTLTYDLVAGVEYKITMNGFSAATWDVAAATITYEVVFTTGAGEMEYVDLDLSDVELVVGEQNIELLPNAITTLYNFTAPEAGIYTVTIPNDAIAELYNVAWTSYQICDGNTLVFTATADEQGFLIGLTSEADSMNVKIEKTGTYTPPAQTEYKDYVAQNEIVEDFAQPEEVVSVDITAAQTVVKGEDGFYHLGTADGPVLMVNLNSEGFTLATLFDAGAPITMRGEVFTGENGNPCGYDYMNLIAYGPYYAYSRENDYHPLNDDLMAFLKDYGAAQGWYNQNMSSFDAIKAGGFNEESAWMAALVYVEDAGNQGGNTGNEGGNTGNTGSNTGNTGSNTQTGDFGVIAAAIALTASAIGGTAVIAKKKEN